MTSDFSSAMRRSLDAVRGQNPAEATRIIQDALKGGTTAEADGLPPPKVAIPPKSAPISAALKALFRRKKNGARLAPLMRDAVLPPTLAEGAQFPMRSISMAGVSRDYRLYIPVSGKPRGLVVMLHGCTQNPDDFARGTDMNTVAERFDLAVVYPAQTGAHNANACWNWFEPQHQTRGTGEPALIAAITQSVVAELSIDPSLVFVAGLSAGGAMAAVMAETYPELYAAAGIHSGLATGMASDVMSAFAAMRGQGAAGKASDKGHPRVIVFHGSADSTVHVSNADRIVAGLDLGSLQSQTARFEQGGRSVTRTSHGETLEDWRIDGAGHAWSGGRADGSYTDPTGPDASAEMVRFFLQMPDDVVPDADTL